MTSPQQGLAFAITSSNADVKLEGGKGEVSYTVTNNLDRNVVARALVSTDNPAAAKWVRVDGRTERPLTAKTGSDSFVVKIEAPSGAPIGDYKIQFDVVDVEAQEKNYARGPVVGFKVTAPVVVNGGGGTTKVPWWLFVVAGVVALVLIGGGVWYATRDHGKTAKAGTVPSVLGLTVGAARDSLKKFSLKDTLISERELRAGAAAGTVVQQEPADSAAAAKDTAWSNGKDRVVKLWVQGKSIPVPTVKGFRLADAAATLVGLNLLPVGATSSVQDSTKIGIVIGTNPPEGKPALIGDTVQVVYGVDGRCTSPFCRDRNIDISKLAAVFEINRTKAFKKSGGEFRGRK